MTGLPISSFFTSYKIHWLLQNMAEVERAAAEGRCLVGTIDTWLIWNLTGGQNGNPPSHGHLRPHSHLTTSPAYHKDRLIVMFAAPPPS